MMNNVLENMLGKSVEQRFDEIEVKEVRAKRQAETDAQMKNKGKSVEGDDEEEDEEEENVDEEKSDDADDVFSASSYSDDDDDNGQGGIGIKVTETSNEQNVDDFLHDDANEEAEDASCEGENVEDQNIDKQEKLILRLEPQVEEGEFRHIYRDDADIDELRRKVAECLKDRNFDGTLKDPQKEERKKWFRKSNERMFKRPLKYYKRDKDVSLGDIISRGFLP
ncbi:hypothetical protein Hanom_Chr13g01202381 [Helianthus anomalus]